MVTVISSKTERKKDIESFGAKAAIGAMQDVDFLSATFRGADIIYLMEAWERIGSMPDDDIDFVAAFKNIGSNYKQAVEQSGVKCIAHLSSIGAHTNKGNGSLAVHHELENILRKLPGDVSIKFMRPVGFYTNTYRYMQTIKTRGAIIQSYVGDEKEPWVSPLDVVAAIAEEMEKPFEGRTVRYIVGDEVSPNEVAKILGEAIGKPNLKWLTVPGEQQLNGMLAMGMNKWIAKGFVEMQASQGSGVLYENYNRNKPTLGKVKLTNFAKDFAMACNK